jgi:hypothetical protein
METTNNNYTAEISLVVSNDFKITESESLIPEIDSRTLEEFKAYLTEKLSYLLDNKYNTLINILYRIDVNEEKLRELFAVRNRENIPYELAELIIERSLQKVKFRQKYKNGTL